MEGKNIVEKAARDIQSVYGLYFAGRVLWLVGTLFLLLEGVCFLTLSNPLIILVCIFFNIFSALVGVFCGYTIIGLKEYDKGYIAAGISFVLLCIAGCVSAIRIVNVPVLIAFGVLAYIFGFVFCRTTGKALRSIDTKLSVLWKIPFGIYVKEQDTEHNNVNTKRYLPKLRELNVDTSQSIAGRSAKYKAEYISQNAKSDQ